MNAGSGHGTVKGEKYYAPRRPKPPPLGKRPGVLLDPEPQCVQPRSVTWLPRAPPRTACPGWWRHPGRRDCAVPPGAVSPAAPEEEERKKQKELRREKEERAKAAEEEEAKISQACAAFLPVSPNTCQLCHAKAPRSFAACGLTWCAVVHTCRRRIRLSAQGLARGDEPRRACLLDVVWTSQHLCIGRGGGHFARSKWANPFQLQHCASREQCLVKFRCHVLASPQLLNANFRAQGSHPHLPLQNLERLSRRCSIAAAGRESTLPSFLQFLRHACWVSEACSRCSLRTYSSTRELRSFAANAQESVASALGCRDRTRRRNLRNDANESMSV